MWKLLNRASRSFLPYMPTKVSYLCMCLSYAACGSYILNILHLVKQQQQQQPMPPRASLHSHHDNSRPALRMSIRFSARRATACRLIIVWLPGAPYSSTRHARNINLTIHRSSRILRHQAPLLSMQHVQRPLSNRQLPPTLSLNIGLGLVGLRFDPHLSRLSIDSRCPRTN